MSTAAQQSRPSSPASGQQTPPVGPVAAAILATGIGCFALGVLTVLARASQTLAAALTWFAPTGPLSGVTSLAILFWLLAWVGLAGLWRRRDVPIGRTTAVALVLLAVGFLLTFPPFAAWLPGK